MFFSILIPVYNTREYIDKCLDSILSQKFDDYEIILLDDASTDDSLKICRNYETQYPSKIRLSRHECNMGLLMTRRDLFKMAKGEWVLCVDSDDWIAEDSLSILKRSIDISKADMILFDLMCRNIDGTEKLFSPGLSDGNIYSGKYKEEIYYRLFNTYYINSMCTKAVKRKIIDADADYRKWSVISRGEDIFQSYPLIDKASKIMYIHQTLYYYRKNSDSMSISITPEMYPMRKLLWERENFYIIKWSLDCQRLEQNYLNRLCEMIHFAMLKLNRDGYGALIDFVSDLNTDLFFEEAYNKCHIKGRYRKYSQLILSEKVKELYINFKIELLLQRLKKLLR